MFSLEKQTYYIRRENNLYKKHGFGKLEKWKKDEKMGDNKQKKMEKKNNKKLVDFLGNLNRK